MMLKDTHGKFFLAKSAYLTDQFPEVCRIHRNNFLSQSVCRKSQSPELRRCSLAMSVSMVSQYAAVYGNGF